MRADFWTQVLRGNIDLEDQVSWPGSDRTTVSQELQMDKLVLTSAPTGAMTVPTQTPHLPYTIEGIADDAIACANAGATTVRIHARNPDNGHPSSDPELVRKIGDPYQRGGDAIICITTGGGMMPQKRLRGTALCQPELASCHLGSMNFSMHPVAHTVDKCARISTSLEMEDAIA